MSEKWLRRSLLYIPGGSPKMLAKAREIACDGVILDLEDSVAIDRKDSARRAVRELIPELTGRGKEVLVRVNAMDGVWGYNDLFAVVPAAPDAVVLPKADEASVVAADMVLGAIERDCGIKPGATRIIALLETARAIADPDRVLAASGRIDGGQLGAEDLTREMGIGRTADGSEIRYARERLATAARARGVDAVDTPFTGVTDFEGLRRDAETAKNIGFTGKTCIHPGHIAIVEAAFSPTRKEVEFARSLLAAYRAALKEGRGACMYEGMMVDLPVAERAERVLEKAERIGGYEEGQVRHG